MDKDNSNDQNNMLFQNDNLLPINNDYNNFNDNFPNQNNEGNNKKEYDIWPKIKVYTYLLFFINIFYIILLSIYFPLILDEKAFSNCLGFVGVSGLFEIIYILYSLCTFCSENKVNIICYYMWIVFLSGLFIFLTSYWDFISFDRGYFTEKCKIIVISGSSLIFLLSSIFLVWAFILINCNKHIKIVFI